MLIQTEEPGMLYVARKRETREKWIQKANDKHHNRYEYSDVPVDVRYNTKVPITCVSHGPFSQTLSAHVQGQGCPKCALEDRSKAYRLTRDEFITKANKRHDNKYVYTNMLFNGLKEDITVYCPEHGYFTSKANNHLQVKGCPSCTDKDRSIYCNLDSFVEAANLKHNSFYRYSNTKLRGKTTKIDVTCPDHGDFVVAPYFHLLGDGCGFCKTSRNEGKISGGSQEQFIFKAKIKHGDKYDYSKVVYKNSKTPVEIICPAHGSFWQLPNGHICSHGCKKCGAKRISSSRRLGNEGFIKRAQKTHGDRYDYSKVDYKTNTAKVEIICKAHGSFMQTPVAHFKAGCMMCNTSTFSRQHKEIIAFIQSVYDGPVEFNNRKVIGPKELDVWLPDKNVAIEFNGVYWHSFERVGKNHHIEKTKLCMSRGIRLLHIWEDDWTHKQELVKRHILSVLGLSEEPKVMARKCSVQEISTEQAKKFMEENHIQGFSPSTFKLGLIELDSGDLVACATFRKDSAKNGSYVLTRYATSKHVVGGHSKLVSFFERNFDFDELCTFADLAFSYGDLYTKTGWTEDKLLYPDYSYVVGNKRHHKFGFRLKRFREDEGLLYKDGLTEWELAELNGMSRIYDAGKLRFVKKKV